MKNFFMLLICLPLMVMAQDDPPELVFEIVMLAPQAGMMSDMEAVMATHNKTYHADGTYGARVYSIESGADIGKILWVMGPTQWGALDNRPGKGAHDDDWAKVMKTMAPGAHASYWTFDRKNSHFPADVDINHLYVMYVDVARGKWKDVNYLLGKVKEAYAEKMPDDPYGIYWNQTNSTSEGRDLAVIWFFESWSWMGEDSGFSDKYNEMNGEGAWERWLDDWMAATNGTEIVLWSLQNDMSGTSSMIKAVQRQ